MIVAHDNYQVLGSRRGWACSGGCLVGLVEDHLEWCQLRGLRPNTIDAKRGSLARLARVVPVPVEYADAEQLYGWWRRLPRAPQSRASELSHVRQFFLWLRREGHRVDDPTVRLDAPKVRRRLPRPILDAHLTTALAMASEPVRTWLLLGAFAGLRAMEIAPLRREDLLTTQQPHSLYVADGKGGKERMVPLHPQIEQALEPYPTRSWLFVGADGHVSADRVTRTTNNFLHSIGLGETLHQARHFFGTKFYEASGRDLRATQEVMGHQTPAATAIYTKVDVVRAAVSVAAIRL